MGWLSALFADCAMGFFGKRVLICFAEVAIGETSALCARRPVPSTAITLFAAVPDHNGDDLAGSPTHGRPQPALDAPLAHKAPGLIEFERISGLGGQQRCYERRKNGHMLSNRLGNGETMNTKQPAESA